MRSVASVRDHRSKFHIQNLQEVPHNKLRRGATGKPSFAVCTLYPVLTVFLRWSWILEMGISEKKGGKRVTTLLRRLRNILAILCFSKMKEILTTEISQYADFQWERSCRCIGTNPLSSRALSRRLHWLCTAVICCQQMMDQPARVYDRTFVVIRNIHPKYESRFKLLKNDQLVAWSPNWSECSTSTCLHRFAAPPLIVSW